VDISLGFYVSDKGSCVTHDDALDDAYLKIAQRYTNSTINKANFIFATDISGNVCSNCVENISYMTMEDYRETNDDDKIIGFAFYNMKDDDFIKYNELISHKPNISLII
jgi:hypothetical protein